MSVMVIAREKVYNTDATQNQTKVQSIKHNQRSERRNTAGFLPYPHTEPFDTPLSYLLSVIE